MSLIKLAQTLALYQEEEFSTFTHTREKYHLNTVLSLVSSRPIKKVSVDKLSWILAHGRPVKYRIKRADLNTPILVTRWKGKLVVLDGFHRVAKAVELGEKQLKARFVTKEDLDKAKVYNIMQQAD